MNPCLYRDNKFISGIDSTAVKLIIFFYVINKRACVFLAEIIIFCNTPKSVTGFYMNQYVLKFIRLGSVILYGRKSAAGEYKQYCQKGGKSSSFYYYGSFTFFHNSRLQTKICLLYESIIPECMFGVKRKIRINVRYF